MSRQRRLALALALALALVATAAVGEETVCQRRQIGENMCPELFVLGVQKGGSSSIWVWLNSNYPSIEIASSVEAWKRKETHFFDIYSGRGVDWYASLYPARTSSDAVAMDGTPCYTRHWQVAERMKKQLPISNLRFIVAFRNPNARAYSWYRHVMAEFISDARGYGNVYRAFNFSFRAMVMYVAPHISACLKLRNVDSMHRHCAFNNDFYRRRDFYVGVTNTTLRDITPAVMLVTDGMYGYIMRHWFKHFAPSQFCLLFFEYLVRDFGAEMAHAAPCLQHFNLELRVAPGEALPRVNTKTCDTCELLDETSRVEVANFLNSQIFDMSNQELFSLVREHYDRDPALVWS